uniref:Uncharacterized protein n=1 Tax=Octopus bimaculoides TaxID=37653 RepID=A0A0L8G157_OCTBM
MCAGFLREVFLDYILEDIWYTLNSNNKLTIFSIVKEYFCRNVLSFYHIRHRSIFKIEINRNYVSNSLMPK